MLGKKNESNSTIESSAFVITKAHASRQNGLNLQRNEERPRIWWDHCNELCYTRDTYWFMENLLIGSQRTKKVALSYYFIGHSGKNSSPYIINSGASDHMTNLSHSFHPFTPCSSHEKV